jgi:ElaB/YqjD/DUF883 family membrane-anchored ribosome-binding protein
MVAVRAALCRSFRFHFSMKETYMNAPNINDKIDDVATKAKQITAEAGKQVETAGAKGAGIVQSLEHKASEAVQHAGHQIKEAAQKVGHKAQEMATKVEHTAHDMATKVSNKLKSES